MSKDESVDLQIDVHQVCERLASKISRLELENAQLSVGVEAMAKRIVDLEHPKDASGTGDPGVASRP